MSSTFTARLIITFVNNSEQTKTLKLKAKTIQQAKIELDIEAKERLMGKTYIEIGEANFLTDKVLSWKIQDIEQIND